MKRATGAVRNRRILYAVASALLLASLGVGVLVVSGRTSTTAEASARNGATEAAALLAARTEAIAFFTLDPQHVESQVDGVLAHATGGFLTEYTGNRSEVVQSVTTLHRVVSASVSPGGSAIANFSDTSAVVLIAINETSQEGGAAPVVAELRMRLVMKRVDTSWKTTSLDQLVPSVSPGEAAQGALPGGNDAVLAAATKGVRRLLSYDYRTLNQDLDATLPMLTAAFGAEFARTFDSSVRPLAVQKKSTTIAYIRADGLVTRDLNRARCLVYADQVLAPTGTPTVAGSRLFVDLKRVNGNWLIEALSRA